MPGFNEIQELVEIVEQVKKKVDLVYNPSIWKQNSNYKYLRNPIPHIKRAVSVLEFIKLLKLDSLCDLGPGNGYLLYLARLSGNFKYVKGIDYYEELRPELSCVYMQLMHHLDLKIDTERGVQKQQGIVFGKFFSVITAINCVFMKSWRESDAEYFLNDCRAHLKPGGVIIINFALDQVNAQVYNYVQKTAFTKGPYFVITKDPLFVE